MRLLNTQMQFKQKTPDNNNGRKKKDRSTNNDLQNTTQKTKDPATRTNTQKWGWGGDSRAPEGYSVLAPQVAPVVLLLLRK
jgi:hypothetical protein